MIDSIIWSLLEENSKSLTSKHFHDIQDLEIVHIYISIESKCIHASMMSENTAENLEDQVCASANRCLFKQYLESCHINNQFANKELTAFRKQTVIVKSIARGDSLQVDINKLTSLAYHSNSFCYLDYTSNKKIDRYLKRKK